MGLVQVATNTVTSAVSSVTLTGIDDESVYMLAFTDVQGSVDSAQARFRVTTSGSPDTSSNYDRAHLIPRTSTSFANVTTTNGTYWIYNEIGTATGEELNGIMYLYNFNNSSEYCFYTLESAERISSGELQGVAGGGVHTVTQACDGIQMFANSGDFNTGTFTLYKVV